MQHVTAKYGHAHLSGLIAKQQPRRLSEVQHRIRNMDLGLLRSPGDGISLAARSEFCHALRMVWWFPSYEPRDSNTDALLAHSERTGTLMVVETRLGYGCRAIPLAKIVAKYPGQLYLFETNPNNLAPCYDREKAATFLLSQCGQRYGAWNVARGFASFCPGVRWFVRPDLDPASRSGLPDCSQQSVEADQAGGVTPVEQLATRLTLPGDLAHSMFYRLQFALLPG
jgi:hypothetical protein